MQANVLQTKACKKMKLAIENITVDTLQDYFLTEKKISLSVLRLDKIHPVLSGNKIFKLHFFLDEAKQSSHKAILTFGGAYSNHLVATAFVCKEEGLNCTGIVRGDASAQLSPTLQQCKKYGMQLKFMSRNDYAQRHDEDFIADLKKKYGAFTFIPEGGYHSLGAKGAALIYNSFDATAYTHICTAAGTATTLAGLLSAATNNQTIIGVNVLKGINDSKKRLAYLTGYSDYKNLVLLNDYHFGGYAKKNDELISFMNNFWQKHNIATDFVYTAKMFYAITNKIKQGYFAEGSRILCIHTGGLQGNRSLPVDSLLF